METPEIPQNTSEALKNQHFDYLLVFGQGPVQESKKIPAAGREGLNFYSRLNALAAAQMLKTGIVDKVILSGGQTGARAGTPEAKTEADLLADIIRRKLTSVSKDGKSYLANGKNIPIYDAEGNSRPQSDVDREIQAAFADRILIENISKDTLENFALILNKFIDKGIGSDARLALLGTGFHAKDTYNGTGEGRLEALAEIFDVGKNVFSAEEILRSLVADGEKHGEYVAKELTRLTDLAENHPVTILKSMQERALVQGLRAGDWKRIVPVLQNQERARRILANDPYVSDELMKQFNITREQITQIDFGELIVKINELKVKGVQNYAVIKQAVFDALKAMSEKEGIDYFGKYAKGEIPSK